MPYLFAISLHGLFVHSESGNENVSNTFVQMRPRLHESNRIRKVDGH